MATQQLSRASERTDHPASNYDVVRAVTRFEVAKARYAELSAVNAIDLSGAQYIALGDVQYTMAASRRFLERAGLAHLIEVSS
ncbi:hypothetical protein ABZT43_12330 [Streptomyces sp. NPDC005349]|uniref:hypothetical protein n=1 Tax=Streptomyces sp. NPDC005349 TaxID=3157037 RepID=UPI0033B48F67